MKIAIIGSGSIGLYYGAKLALSGQDVHFLMRSGRTEAARDGIHIFSEADGDAWLGDVQHHVSAGEIGRCNLVIIALKTTQNASLTAHVPPLLAPDTILLTLQNGLGNEEFLAERFGAGHVMGGLCFVCLTRESPASVRHFGHGAVSIGEYQGPPQARTERVIAAFGDAGIETRGVDDLIGERWRKLVWNIPFNGIAVAEGGIAVDNILASPALFQQCRELMDETIAVAEKLGHPIRPGFAEFQIARTRDMGPYLPSTAVDFLAGRELEIDSIWGEPLRQARAAQVPTPRLEALHARLAEIGRKLQAPPPDDPPA